MQVIVRFCDDVQMTFVSNGQVIYFKNFPLENNILDELYSEIINVNVETLHLLFPPSIVEDGKVLNEFNAKGSLIKLGISTEDLYGVNTLCKAVNAQEVKYFNDISYYGLIVEGDVICVDHYLKDLLQIITFKDNTIVDYRICSTQTLNSEVSKISNHFGITNILNVVGHYFKDLEEVLNYSSLDPKDKKLLSRNLFVLSKDIDSIDVSKGNILDLDGDILDDDDVLEDKEAQKEVSASLEEPSSQLERFKKYLTVNTILGAFIVLSLSLLIYGVFVNGSVNKSIGNLSNDLSMKSENIISLQLDLEEGLKLKERRNVIDKVNTIIRVLSNESVAYFNINVSERSVEFTIREEELVNLEAGLKELISIIENYEDVSESYGKDYVTVVGIMLD